MKNQRGQASVELVLLAGVFLVIVILVFPTILKQQDMNKAVAAAREGATAGAAIRGLGFSSNGGNEEGMVRIEDITLNKTGTIGDLEQYQIKFYVSAPDYLKDGSSCVGSSIGGTIRTQAKRHIYYVTHGQWAAGAIFGAVNTTYFSFTTSCEWV
jgi:hypothetical protein